MFQQTTALLAINLPLLSNNQSLTLAFRNLGVQVVNKNPINTKESFLIELENFKPSYSFVYANLAGVIDLQEVISKAKKISPNTKLILVTNDTDKTLNLFLSEVNAVISLENLSSCLEYALKQINKGEIFLCGKSLIDIKTSLTTKKQELKFDLGLLNSLTDRELEVLQSLTKGVNYKQISKGLFISESTVKTHVNNIFTKLNVNDRTQAVLYGLNHGIESLIKKTHVLDNLLNEPAQ